MTSLRNRRIEGEWSLLQQLAASNPSILTTIARSENSFDVRLEHTPAWFLREGRTVVVTSHAVRYLFPRFYPALPIEAYLFRPTFHPNVDRTSGFVCLWPDYRPRQTICDALQVTRAILAHVTSNLHPEHLMQAEALGRDPLAIPPLVVPESCRPMQPASRPRTSPRLTSIPT